MMDMRIPYPKILPEISKLLSSSLIFPHISNVSIIKMILTWKEYDPALSNIQYAEPQELSVLQAGRRYLAK